MSDSYKINDDLSEMTPEMSEALHKRATAPKDEGIVTYSREEFDEKFVVERGAVFPREMLQDTSTKPRPRHDFLDVHQRSDEDGSDNR